MISIAIPTHNIPQKEFFLHRLIKSIEDQTFKDYEVIIENDHEGRGMAYNTNNAIKKCGGELIKVMQMDDFFAHPDALMNIVNAFGSADQWLVTGCLHTTDGVNRLNPHYPEWNDKIYTGNNTLGGLSTITIRNDNPELFEEPLTWVVDCDWYMKWYKRGKPKLLDDLNVVIQWGEHQTTNKLTDEEKQKEVEYLIKKYEND